MKIHSRYLNLAALLYTASFGIAQAAATAPVTIPVPKTTIDTSVQTGCAVPSLKIVRSFYVDPLHGNIANDGSAKHPWSTLQAVMANPKLSNFQPGDVIYLLNGNHGSVNIYNKFNSDFVTIRALPGNTPQLSALNIVGSKWVIAGLKIQGNPSTTTAASLVHMSGSSAATSPTQNIIFTGNTVSSADDSSGWSQKDWLSKALQGVSIDGRGGNNCIALTQNALYNVKTGIGTTSSKTLIANNTIDTFAYDAMDLGGDNLTLSHNYITNIVDPGDGMHPDAMQFYIPGGNGYAMTSFSNIVIDSNKIIRQSNPNLKHPNNMQGIDSFSGSRAMDLYNVKITNNLVVTNTYHGITFGSIHDSLIANNTVVPDGIPNTASFNAGQSVVDGKTVWIMVGDLDDGLGSKSSNVVIRNNIAPIYQINATSPTVTFDHNFASTQLALPAGSKMQYISKPGTYGTNNVLDPNLYTSNLVKYDPAHFSLDAHLKATTTLKTAGSSTLMPKVDIDNTARVLPTPGASAVSAYTGSVTIYANARQTGNPRMAVSINGVKVGEAAITADSHLGKTGYYTVNYASSTKPATLSISMLNDAASTNTSGFAAIFGLALNENKVAVKNLLLEGVTATPGKGVVLFNKIMPEFTATNAPVTFNLQKYQSGF